MAKTGREAGAVEIPLSEEMGTWLQIQAERVGWKPTDAQGLSRQHVHKIYKAKIAKSGKLRRLCEQIGVKLPDGLTLARWCYVLVRLWNDAPERIAKIIADELEFADLRASRNGRIERH